jgi:uncharacterized membrane protein
MLTPTLVTRLFLKICYLLSQGDAATPDQRASQARLGPAPARTKEVIMVETIGNPLSWGAKAIVGAGSSMSEAAATVGGSGQTRPRAQAITLADLRTALRRGVEDFSALRTDVIFLAAVYPIVGVLLSAIAFHSAMLPLLFPMAAGFALLGPVAAIGLYEMSRQREAGHEIGWGAALSALRARAMGPVLVLGLILMAIFTVWMFTAHEIYAATLGPDLPQSISAFAAAVLTTGPGWTMIIVGFGVGFVFAAGVLTISLVSFPMLIDRRVGVPVAVITSIRVVRKNPATVAAWGLFVAASLVVASIPAFLGLIFAMPILGHATWHLYRAAVVHEPIGPA